MGNIPSQPPKHALLRHPLNIHILRIQETLKPKQPVFYHQMARPQSQLNNGSPWPKEGTVDFGVLHDLHSFSYHNAKGSEILYVQAFFCLQDAPLSRSLAWPKYPWPNPLPDNLPVLLMMSLCLCSPSTVPTGTSSFFLLNQPHPPCLHLTPHSPSPPPLAPASSHHS